MDPDPGEEVSASPSEQFGGFPKPLTDWTDCSAEGGLSRVDHRREDEQLLRQLRSAGFDGAAAKYVSDALIRYGWAVLDALMRSGAVFAHAQVLGRGVTCPDWLRERLRGSKADREDLAAEIVSRVFPRFWSEALVGGGWRADGEASIASYFSNALLMEFSNVFRVWMRHQLQSEPLDAEVADPRALVGGETDARLHVLTQLRGLPPRQQQYVALHYDGYSHTEIMELTGATSERAVEAVLYRWRRHQVAVRSRSEGEEGQP